MGLSNAAVSFLASNVLSSNCCIQHVYIYKYRQIQMQANSIVSDTNAFINDFGSSTRGERHNSYFANHTIWSHFNARRILWCLRSLVGSDLQNSTTSSTLCLNGRELNSLPQWQKLNSQLSTDSFSKSSNSQDHLFWAWRYPHSSPFPVWVLLWQWWLSYPLCASVKLYQLTIHLGS